MWRQRAEAGATTVVQIRADGFLYQHGSSQDEKQQKHLGYILEAETMRFAERWDWDSEDK